MSKKYILDLEAYAEKVYYYKILGKEVKVPDLSLSIYMQLLYIFKRIGKIKEMTDKGEKIEANNFRQLDNELYDFVYSVLTLYDENQIEMSELKKLNRNQIMTFINSLEKIINENQKIEKSADLSKIDKLKKKELIKNPNPKEPSPTSLE